MEKYIQRKKRITKCVVAERIWKPPTVGDFFPWLNETFLNTHSYPMEIPTSRLGNFLYPQFLAFFFFSSSILARVFPLTSFGNISSLLYLFPGCNYVNNLLIYLNGFLTSYGHIWKATVVTECIYEDTVKQISLL